MATPLRVILPLAVLLVAAVLPASATGDEGRVIVAFDVLPRDHATYAGERVVAVDASGDFLVVHARSARALEARAADDPRVRWVEPDLEQYHTTLTPSDTHFSKQYGLAASTTDIAGAWDTTLGATAVKVCVVDTGQYRAHKDFAGATWAGWKDLVNGRTTAYDDNGHGTHVTGTIGAVTDNGRGVAGVAQVSLLGVKVLSKAGWGTNSGVASGIRWCADQGAHVVSLSLGGGASTAVAEAVTYADGLGALVVAAAGNGGPCSDCVSYPAALPAAMAVACTDAANAVCSFSSAGPEVDIAAPGRSILSTWANVNPCTKRSTECYVYASGTSMSTPHVSGVAALVKSADASLTMDDVRARLLATARDLGPTGPDDATGAGLLQGAAVR